MSLPVIETINLTKDFKNAGRVLDNVNIHVNEGELLGLIGPNGAGKTTFLKLLSGLILPTCGNAFIMGHNTITGGQKIKSLVGVITGEERSFYWRLTGRQNLVFWGTLYNLSTQQINERIPYLANLLEIQSMLDRRFMEYSTGIKQCFSIARALLHNPSVLLIDEPTKSLDAGAAKKLRSFIKEQLVREQHKTVILTTHQIEEASVMCDRIAILVKGKIRTCDTVNNLMKGSSINTLDEAFTYYTNQ